MLRLKQMVAAAEARGEVLAAGTVVVADTLTRSNGRFDRKWYAPPGGAWLSLAWPDVLLPEFTRLLPFAVGLACCRTIRAYQLDARLKWVNDILLGGKKIAGILCETFFSKQGDAYHLLGTGINVNNSIFPGELVPSAACMADALGHDVDLEEFIARLLAEMTLALGILHHDEALSLQQGSQDGQVQAGHLFRLWEQLCDTGGRLVEFGHDVQKKPLYQAVVTGYDQSGGLILKLADGRRIVEYSGEIRYL